MNATPVREVRAGQHELPVVEHAVAAETTERRKRAVPRESPEIHERAATVESTEKLERADGEETPVGVLCAGS